jgi:uncharacterized protein YcfJ
MSHTARFATSLGLLTALVAAPALAQEQARVISSTQILERVQTPQQVCVDRQVAVQAQKSGGGAVMGAIAGGAVGNAIGEGSGNALATAIGLIGGAMLGDRIEGSPGSTMQTVRDCRTEVRETTRVRGYRVVYEYAGQRYEVETPQAPGATIPVQVSPALPLMQPQSAPVVTPPAVSQRNWVSAPRTVLAAPLHASVVISSRHDAWRVSPRVHERRSHRRDHGQRHEDRRYRSTWGH